MMAVNTKLRHSLPIAVVGLLLVIATSAPCQNSYPQNSAPRGECSSAYEGECSSIDSEQISPSQSQRLPPLTTPQSRTSVLDADTGISGKRLPTAIERTLASKKKQPASPTEFEQMVADSVGRRLRVFGSSLFEDTPTTFAPVSGSPAPSDYVIGPGDELDIRVWGQVNLNVRSTVDRAGQIYVPQVGSFSVAGVQYARLEERIKSEIGRIYKNFQLTASLQRLRTVQIFVVGEAASPGQYTVSSLSSLVNAVFASGGPGPNGSLRRIQLKRGSQVATELDLYELLIRGDKSKDVPILPGDVIFYPPATGFVAVAGSVNVPAIYELREQVTLRHLLEDAGGTTVVADDQRFSIERIDANGTRSVVEVSQAQANDFDIKKGDIVRVLSMVPRFDNTVTIRGSVANPGRYPWKPGMRISDLIPDSTALLTRRYWLDRAKLTDGRSTEYPVPDNVEIKNRQVGRNDSKAQSAQLDVLQDSTANRLPGQQQVANADKKVLSESNLAAEIRNTAPEINWDYALIQRVNPVDLTTRLIPFNLAKVVIDHDLAQNFELMPGDVISIFSQKEVTVPSKRKTQFIKIEGEVRAPGVYKIEASDTLRTVIERAGGITEDAYLFGAQLTRESARLQQQKSIDDTIKMLSAQLQQTSSAALNGNPDQAATIEARASSQQQLLAGLREIRAPGRVVLQIDPAAHSLEYVPPIALEDGDRFVVPHKPATVSVIGAVYNQSSFLYSHKRKLSDYFNLAGRSTPIADKRRMFVLRADGSVVSSQSANGMWSGGFGAYRLMPGDTLVVPTKLETGAFQRSLRDWTQVFSQLAIAAASIAVIRN